MIVGILKESGVGDDSKIIMPIKAARDTLEDVGTDKFSLISIKVNNPDRVEEIVVAAEKKLLVSRHLTEKRSKIMYSFFLTIASGDIDNNKQETYLFLG